MIQGFVGFLDGAKRPFNLALRARRRTGTVLAGWNMRLPFDIERLHDILEYPALRDGAVIEIKHLRSSLEGKPGISFCRHRIKQEAQC